jgi:hypothetical protein
MQTFVYLFLGDLKNSTAEAFASAVSSGKKGKN